MLSMCYFIFDHSKNCYLVDKNNNRIHCDTLMDCFDYLEYILKITDFDRFSFLQEMVNY